MAGAKLYVQIMDKKTLAQFKEFDSAPENNTVEGLFQPIRRLVKFAISLSIRNAREKAKKAGKEFDEAKAEETLNQFVDGIGDGQIWQWLINGGFKKLLEILAEVLVIFI